MQKTKRIPTLLAILLLLVIIGFIGFLFEGMTRQEAKATLSIEPKSVMITNLTDTSFTFTWQTDELATGTLLVTSSNGKKYSSFDQRDITGKMGKYLTHSVTVRTLAPSTTHDVTILSNGKKYPIDKKSFSVTTLPTLTSDTPLLDPAFGSIKTATNAPAEGALVYISLEGSQTLSTLVGTSGSWIIPLSLLRTQDGAAYITLQERINETLVVQLGTSESRVTTDTLNDAPVPDIVLGETYDFRGKDAKKTTPATLAQKPGQSVLGVSTDKAINGVALTAPVQGATLSSTKPLITGIGISGKTVTITIGITEPTIGSTVVGKDGVWKYTPKQTLAPGKQSITITTVDAKNKAVAITHTFTILKSGSQVLGDATPSGNIVETPTPIPTIEATESATPTETLTGEEIPTSGSVLPTLLLIVLGCSLFIGGGAVLLIK
ncbi:MAG: hypothetical protein ACD_48C00373G0007 [uncultured bacterium]|nr:MAG: hypothetical protein ACD_48C00373G0007 [uncultured bacterium]